MKKGFLLLCVLMSLHIVGQSVSNVGFKTSSSGWFKIGKWTTGQRGSERIVISFSGGAHTPQEVIVDVFKDWSSGFYIDVKGIRNYYIKQIRITNDSNYYYLEAYFDREILSNGYIHLYNLGGNSSGLTLNPGVLPIGSGTVVYETGEIFETTLIGNNLDIRKNITAKGKIISQAEVRIVHTNPAILFNETDVADKNWHLQVNDGDFKFYEVNDARTTWSQKMIIKNGGQVGIGTSSPEAKLQINDAGTSGVTTLQLNNRIKFRGDGVVSWGPEANVGVLSWAGDKAIVGAKSTKNLSLYAGGVEKVLIKTDGNVGIGTTNTGTHKLAVEGSIGAREIKVEAFPNWSDFVFYNDYKLPTLNEVENHIKEKRHLKNIPSAKEIEKNGFFLGEMDAKLLQKIEELTLYTIQQEKSLKSQKTAIMHLKKQQSKLEKENKILKSLLERVSKLEKSINRK